MNDEEVVVPEQEQQQQQAPQEKKTLSQSTRDIRDRIEEVGDTVENFGKAEEKAGQWLKGGNKGTEVAANAGSATSSAVEAGSKVAETAADASKAASKVQDAAGKVNETAGKINETAGKISEGIGKGTKAVGKAEEGVGQGLDTNPYTAAAGKVAKGVGKGTQVAGSVGEGVGKGQQAVGKGQQASGKAQQTGAKAQEVASDASKKAAQGTGAAAKASKTGTEAAKKGNEGSKSLADKLEEGGRKHQKIGKDIKKFAGDIDSDKVIDNLFDKIGKGGKGLGKFLKGIVKLFDPETIATIATIFLILITIATMLVAYILSPMFYMDIIKKTVADPDKVEKVTNFVNGLGFKDSEEAFYNEVNYLNTHYSKEMDISYIMAALYYTDIYNTTSETYLIEDESKSICDLIPFKSDDTKSTCDELQIGVRLAKHYIKSYITEATSTRDEVGLVYSANKIYRLRELAKHQFMGEKELKEASLNDYLGICAEKIGNEFKNMVQYFPLLIAYAIAHVDPTTGALFDQAILNIEGGMIFFDLLEIVNGTETWASVMTKIKNGQGNEIFYDVRNLMETLYNCVYQIDHIEFDMNIDDYLGHAKFLVQSVLFPGVDFDDPSAVIKEILLPGYGITIGQVESTLKGDLPSSLSKVLDHAKNIISNVKIYYYDYKYDNEKFEEYLVDYYIPNMPEFSSLIRGKDGKKDKDKIKQVAGDIYQTKTLFEKMYQLEESAKETNKCIGDINLDLLAELTPPVDLTIGQTVKFTADVNYGLYKGYMHNGVDLNPDTTGTKAGDNVYSIYDGVVLTSTVDGTYPDKTVKGGWVSIQYKVQYTDSEILDGVISNQFKNKISTITAYYGGLDTSTLKLKQGAVVKAGDTIGTVGKAEMSETGKKASLHFGIYDDKSDFFLNPVNMFITCKAIDSASGLSVHNIAISKADFVSATKKYINSNGGTALSNWDLEKTYEASKENGVNPELVVIRAIKEGFSPGKSKNNYWGIGCYNTGNSCTSYSSFESGIAGFARVVNKYDTIEDMMSEYAYIGNYWYNPGSWSLGGCKYFPYIKKYMTDARIDEVSSYCSSSKSCSKSGDGDCHKTTADDQKAYAKYNCEGMNALYEKIYAEYHKK